MSTLRSLSSRFYSQFPREFGLKRRIVKTEADFWRQVNLHNGKMNCYTTLYDYDEQTEWGKPIYESCIWDRMLWDFDNEGDLANELMLQLTDHLVSSDILHTNVFSGRGYHNYTFCKPNLQSPAYAIRAYQAEVCKDLGISMDVKNGLDPTSIANGTKIIRIIGTMNTRAEGRRACLSIPRSMLRAGHTAVREHARIPNMKMHKVGKVEIDLSSYDIEAVDFNTVYGGEAIELGEATPIMKEELPPCIVSLLDNPNVKDDGRQVVMSFLGYLAREGVEPKALTYDSRQQATDIVMQAIAEHSNPETSKWKKYTPRRRVSNVIDNILHPYSCNRLRDMGLCVDECKTNSMCSLGGGV